MLVLGVKSGEGVKIGDTVLLLEESPPDRRLSIEGAPPGPIRVSLTPTKAKVEFLGARVVLWKIKGNSTRVGVETDERLPVVRVRRTSGDNRAPVPSRENDDDAGT